MMNATFSPKRMAIRSGLLAGLYLAGPVPLLFALLMGLSLLPWHLDRLLREQHILGLLFLLCLLGGAAWGRALARHLAVRHPWRLALASGLSFGVATPLATIPLTQLEVALVQRGGSHLPVHVLFALLFVPAVATVAALVGGALGLALGRWRLAGLLALVGGGSAGLAFLLATVVQDLLGRRVGAPGAEATMTMLTVMAIGNLLAAMVGGGSLSWVLARTIGCRAAASEDSLPAVVMPAN